MGKQSAGFGKYNTYSRFAWFTYACAWPPERARFPMNLKVLSACPLRISRTPCSRSWPSREGTSASRGCTPHTCSFACRGGSRCTPCSAVSACRAGTGCPHGKRKDGVHTTQLFFFDFPCGQGWPPPPSPPPPPPLLTGGGEPYNVVSEHLRVRLARALKEYRVRLSRRRSLLFEHGICRQRFGCFDFSPLSQRPMRPHVSTHLSPEATGLGATSVHCSRRRRYGGRDGGFHDSGSVGGGQGEDWP
jgi:hypothetical protein